MYKYLLAWKYLRTRWIALASVISVMLGVATMIVVNSVMAGFTREMQSRIHNILSDVVVESHSLEGFPDPEAHMAKIHEVVGEYISGMTPTVVVPAMLSFRVQGQWMTRQINLIGVDEVTQATVSNFSQYLQHPSNRRELSFDLHENGYDIRDHQSPEGGERVQMATAGWQWRRWWANWEKAQRGQFDDSRDTEAESRGPESSRNVDSAAEAEIDATDRALGRDQTAANNDRLPSLDTPELTAADAAADTDNDSPPVEDPFLRREEHVFDPASEQHTGAILGIAMASFRGHDGTDKFMVLPGADVKITVPTAGTPPKAVSDEFTIVDFYESKMNEYDSGFAFIPIRKLQAMRGMIDPASGLGAVTAIQIKLKDDADGDLVRDKLASVLPPRLYAVNTWRDKQGPLLAAVAMETAILNVLLFMIIAVAGFGILAIFFMIVVEKTKDIGVLKSLGASARGVMGIFLAYGLSLGFVGSGIGLAIGLLFVANINEIAAVLSAITGRQVFDPTIYYFHKIPTIVEPFTVGWVVVGAMLIAVLASILPARRAARLRPVEALRYE